ncbi:excinuclease ABC subunit UvrC [Butyrivibrio sp. NC3005]|uniref:excinuclease ABC subunit UvrC n=1 Tax=Butyrivibrio sp. NC3005 TaxID=1280685 RepID=UPI0004154EA3|nr:excinuclease ABC subunit UvrC [Butyrivibrio sp. NC3005]
MKFDIKEELKKLPNKPGVYIMHDVDDTIMYVGKAVNLHKRVQSYFRKIVGRGPQIDQMVQQIARFEYIVTDSEMEALVLENNLIKEHRPRYNTMLKDDKTYPYIKVTIQEKFPRILFSRIMKKDKAKYFGPFTSAQALKSTIDLINKIYGLRDCNRNLPKEIGNQRPCLNYHMGRCCGPCIGDVSEEDYRERINRAIDFLSGNYSVIIDDLEKKMYDASEKMEFEKAAHYRDLLNDVKTVAQKQKMTDASMEDKDIIAIALDKEDAVVQVFFVRAGRIIGREHFYMTHVGDKKEDEVLLDFVKQFYAGTPFIPREILLPTAIEDMEIIEEWLSVRKGSRMYIKVPERGQKEKLMELAAENARLVLSKDRERIKREEGRTIGAVKEIANILGIPDLNRMEAFDISNISGFANVGSMVVFEKGKPKRSDYRKFRIKSVDGPNDYACMHEVLSRRLMHGLEEKNDLELKRIDEKYGSFTKFPDLILMDGGRGQVNICLDVLNELGIDIPVCGMVKDDNHRTRGLYFNNVELPIDRESEGFKLITRIQDEAHRFAIEYHRSLRSKTQVKSSLDDIPGIGPARRKALMKHFESINQIKDASIEELSSVPEIPESQARIIYDYFHKKSDL